jgi:UDP-N-acetylmuramoylalanine--D-glutamate ligase
VSDSKPESELRDEILLLLEHGITVETGGHGERTFRGQDLIVVSPGVPVDAPQLVQARHLGEPLIGEIELAAQFLSGPIVAITGANGKTTCTSLAGEIIAAGKFSTLVGGNIGTPAISLVDQAGPSDVDGAGGIEFSAGNDCEIPSADRGDSEYHPRPSRSA